MPVAALSADNGSGWCNSNLQLTINVEKIYIIHNVPPY